MSNPVVHFEVIGKDAPTLLGFYREAFGWDFGAPVRGAGISDYWLVQPDAGGIGGGIGAGPEGYRGHATFYIEVPDVARALETIEQHGGTTMMGPDKVPNGPVIALFKDPEGHVIGLTQSQAGMIAQRSQSR
jgi:predicted enzyme related to lactoylglutathione lyase